MAVRAHEVESEPDVDGLLLDELEVAGGFWVEHRATAPAAWPEQRSFLEPVQFDADAGAVRRAVRKCTVEGVLLRARDVRIGVEVVGVVDRCGKRAFEVLA